MPRVRGACITHAGAHEDACGGRAHAPPVDRLSTTTRRGALLAAALRPNRGRLSSRRGRRRGRRGRRCGQSVDCSEGGESSGDGGDAKAASAPSPRGHMKAQVNARRKSMGQWRASGRAAAAPARVRGSRAGLARASTLHGADGRRSPRRLRAREEIGAAPAAASSCSKAPAHGLCARRADAQTSAKGAGASLRRAAAHRRASSDRRQSETGCAAGGGFDVRRSLSKRLVLELKRNVT